MGTSHEGDALATIRLRQLFSVGLPSIHFLEEVETQQGSQQLITELKSINGLQLLFDQ